jgi:hypothetical protein|tara:strand:- start:1097 stop:1276 length:180 start_codon:yes stop_codon:yes gene_type:complete
VIFNSVKTLNKAKDKKWNLHLSPGCHISLKVCQFEIKALTRLAYNHHLIKNPDCKKDIK